MSGVSTAEAEEIQGKNPRKTIRRCNRDCFNCPYEDCILVERERKPRSMDWYYKAKAEGICVKCLKRKAEPGVTTCAECRKNDSESAVKLYHSRARSGRCTNCGKPSVYGLAECEECRAKHRERENRIRQERFREGMCTRCGKHPNAEGRKWCTACLEKGKVERQRCKAKKMFSRNVLSARS